MKMNRQQIATELQVHEIVTVKLAKQLEAELIGPLEVTMYIAEVEQAIKNFCNIDTIPEGLKYVWANMVVDMALYNIELEKGADEIILGALSNVESAKVGDTDVKLGEKSSSSERTKLLNAHAVNLDNIVMNYRDSLYKYRRLVW